jgi:hypothetical protein
MDWKNALTHFKTYVEKIDIINDDFITDDLFEEDNDADTDEEEPSQYEEDFCIFQFEL